MKHEVKADHKDLGHALNGSEAFYHQMVGSLPAAVYSLDDKGRITFFNEMAVNLWGNTPVLNDDKFRYCPCNKVFLPDGTFLPPERTPMAIAIATGQPYRNTEIDIERIDGSRFHASVSIDPMKDEMGIVTGAVIIFHDISEWRKLNIQALRESEERYHRMVAEIQDYAILLLDREGIVQNWNTGAQKIKGYTEKEIVGKHFRQFYLPEDRESRLPERLLNEASINGKALHEGWRVRKDGTRFWGSIVITALHNEENEIIGFSKVTRDLSEKKIAEDKIRQYASDLEFQNRELEEFAYAASHDLKEPLRKIHFYNTFIADNYSSELSEKARDYLERSVAAVRRMRQLIEDILAYTKNTSGLAIIEDVDLGEMAEEVVIHHKEELDDDRVNIEIGELPVVRGISYQLRQVLDNLVSNSVKYRHPERECIIRITSRVVDALQVPLGNPDMSSQYYEVSVQDNGIGFDQRYADKIFEIFQRLHGKTETSGSGIGLAICKKIMQNHKGFIRATGQLNEGARFDLYLPA